MYGFDAYAELAFGETASSSIISAVGSSSGAGAAAGATASTAAASGASSGAGAAAGVGKSTAAAVGSSAGQGGSAAVATAVTPSVGAAAGTAVASGTALSISASVGISSGHGAAFGSASSTAVAVGAAHGYGTVDGRASYIVYRLSADFRSETEAQDSAEVALVFATITHPELLTPIFVVSEGDKGYSTQNGLIVNYRYNGNLFLGCPFAIQLIVDNDQPPTGQVTIPDIGQKIGIEILPLIDSPKIKLEILALSDFSDALDADNARNPVGTPTVEYTADYLYLSNVSGDQISVQATLIGLDYTAEPWPKIRTTQDRLPGLYL